MLRYRIRLRPDAGHRVLCGFRTCDPPVPAVRNPVGRKPVVRSALSPMKSQPPQTAGREKTPIGQRVMLEANLLSRPSLRS